MTFCALPVIALLATGPQADRVQPPANPLAGLPGVEVQVDSLPPDLAPLGLWSANIQMAVELQLRNGGVRVLVPVERQSIRGAPVLSVHILVIPSSVRDSTPVAFAYYLDIQVLERASLARISRLSTQALTWISPRTLGVQRGLMLGSTVRQLLGQDVAQFLTAYRAANPGR
jgi:hypothetical protein